MPVKVSTTAAAGFSLLMPVLTTGLATASEPAWWSEKGVTDTNAGTNNFGVANIGQAKWMATKALEKLNEVAPLLASQVDTSVVFPDAPQNPDASWYEQQKKALNLGQLKSIAYPFYQVLPEAWVAGQMTQNGISNWTGPFPWDAATPVEDNLKVANVGQLKLVFGLRFGESLDGDQTADLRELVYFGTTQLDLDLSQTEWDQVFSQPDPMVRDLDGDGLSDAIEIASGLDPLSIDSDGDGVADSLYADLISRWSLDEADGITVVEDSSQNQIDGSLLSGTRINDGVIGRAISLTKDQQAKVSPAAGEMNVGNEGEEFSVSFWIRLHSTHEPGYNSLIQKGDTSNDRTFGIYLNPDGQTLHARISSDTDPNEGIGASAAQLVPLQWSHVTYVHTANQIKLYINGKLDSTANVGYSVSNDDPLYIGKSNWLRGVNADFDDVMVHRRSLTDEEIEGVAYSWDTDADGLPDVWEMEIVNADPNDDLDDVGDVNPQGTDIYGDFDGDGKSNLQEFQNGTDPVDIYSGGLKWPHDAFVVWLEGDKGVTLDPSNHVDTWANLLDPQQRALQPDFNDRPAPVTDPQTGRSLVEFGLYDDMEMDAGNQDLLGLNDGFTVVFNFARGPLNTSVWAPSVLAHESYGNHGFRTGVLNNGKFHWWSGQSGGDMYLTSTAALVQDEMNTFTLWHNGNAGTSRLYVGDNLDAEVQGKSILSTTADICLNQMYGHEGQPGKYGAVLMFDRALTRGELQMVQDYMAGKYSGTGPLAADTDTDGLYGFEEVVVGTNPGNADSDGDGFGDGEEVNDLGTDPALHAAASDSDGDGVKDDEDAVPNDADIDWEKTPIKYEWVEIANLDPTSSSGYSSVVYTGGNEVLTGGHGYPVAVNKQGRVLFSKGVWHADTGWVTIPLSGSTQVTLDPHGAGTNVTTPTLTSPVLKMHSIGDDGAIVGVDDGSSGIVYHAGMVWSAPASISENGVATAYSAPEYFLGRNPIQELEDGITSLGTIAADGKVLTSIFAEDAQNQTINGLGLYDTTNQGLLSSVLPGIEYDVLYQASSTLDSQRGLAIKSGENGLVLQLRENGSFSDVTDTNLGSGAEWEANFADIALTPTKLENENERLWIAADEAVFLEKKSGGTGASRWVSPASMDEGAIRINGRGEAITRTKVWRNGEYTLIEDILEDVTQKSVTDVQAHDLSSNGMILVQAKVDGTLKAGLIMPKCEYTVRITNNNNEPAMPDKDQANMLVLKRGSTNERSETVKATMVKGMYSLDKDAEPYTDKEVKVRVYDKNNRWVNGVTYTSDSSGTVVITGIDPAHGPFELKAYCGDPDTASASDLDELTCYTIPFTYGGCTSCTESTCQTAETGSYRFSSPIGTLGFGGVSCTLEYYSKDENNRGMSGLSISGGQPTGNFGTGYLFISPDDEAIAVRAVSAPTLYDPMAFRVEYNKASNIAFDQLFKTITIENVLVNNRKVLRTTVTQDGESDVYDYFIDGTGIEAGEPGVNVLTKNGGLERELRWESKWNSDYTTRTERVRVEHLRADGISYEAVSDVETVFTYFSWGSRKTKQIIDPDGEALVSTWSFYDLGENSADPAGSTTAYTGFGRLKSSIRHDGYEETHYYDGYKHTSYSPYAGDVDGKKTVVVWNPGTSTSTTTVSVGMHVVAKQEVIEDAANDTYTYRNYTSASNYLETVKEYFPVAESGRIRKITHPENTVTVYEHHYEQGPPLVVGGQTMYGGHFVITKYEGVPGGSNVVEGTKTVTTINVLGKTESEVVYSVSQDSLKNGHVLSHWVVTSFEEITGRPLQIGYFPDGSGGYAYMTNKAYSCCGVSSETDRYGITTYYAYDQMNRVIKTNRLGVTTETVYDGRSTHTHRYPESPDTAVLPSVRLAGPGNKISTRVRNLTGTISESWQRSPKDGTFVRASSSSTTYLNPEGVSPATLPTGVGSIVVSEVIKTDTEDSAPQQTQQYYVDGKLFKSEGNLSPDMIYSYDAESSTLVTSQSYLVAGNPVQTVTTKSDMAGRTKSVHYADGEISFNTYNSLGQLEKQQDPDGVTTIYAYNAEGQRTTVALDVNGNGIIDAGTDQVSLTDSYAVAAHGTTVRRTDSEVYNSSGIAVLVSQTDSSVDGLKAWSTSFPDGAALESRTEVLMEGSGDWTQKNVSADSSYSLTVYRDGLARSIENYDSLGGLVSSVSYERLSGQSGYDSFNRPVYTTDSRTGESRVYYLNSVTDVVSQSIDAAGHVTAFGRDVRGRSVFIDAPDTLDVNDNVLANVTYYSYYSDGQLEATWGDQTYSRYNIYDEMNRLVELRTYQNLVHGIQPLSTSSGYSATQWIYNQDRGWLVEKNYSGETDDGVSDPDYTYTAAGRLATRDWERGVTTTYAYYTSGRLNTVTYSDSTPDLTYTYNHHGQVETVTQGSGSSVNVHSYSYDSGILLLDSETISYANASHVRTIGRHYDELLRPEGYELKTGTSVEAGASYGYDNAGRLYQVGTSYPLPGSPEFTYGYLAESGGMVETVTGPAHTVTNTYASDRNVLAQKKNEDLATTPATVSHFTYAVNALGQRESQTTAGTAFSSSFVRSFGYDAKGQVVSDNHDTNNTFDRTYAFDGIGNRTSATENTTTVNYSANSKNQYSSVGGTTQVHDADGNLTNDGKTYVYDAENRLIEVKDTGGNTVEQYEYDYLSRRITRSVYGGATVQSFIYDGWNLIAMYNAGALSQTYTWGQDLSGSMQGAGGVGGLLVVSFNSNSYYPTYDGNGNVSEYLDSSGSVVAHFEYDAFGKTVVENGTLAGNFFHRFSTKQWNPLAELYYYGYRYYAPETGRWINRDPIEEMGGLNVYGLVGNDAVLKWDLLGMIPTHAEASEMTLKDMMKTLTQDEVKKLARYSSNGQRDKLADAYIKVLKERKGNVDPEQLVDVSVNQDNGCKCGDLMLRKIKSAWGSGAKSDWFKLSTNNSADLPRDIQQQYQFKIEGGTCDSYSIQLKQRVQKKHIDDDDLNHNNISTTSYNQADYKAPAVKELTGMAHKQGGRPSIWAAPQNYEFVTGEKGQFDVIITVNGTKNGKSDCCTREYQIK
ncbi:LamG-like jellyroll fold domain-containing protein [Rubritalea halochordaticola]